MRNRLPSVNASDTKSRLHAGSQHQARHWPACAQGSFSTAPASNLQLFLGIYATEVLVVHEYSLSLQHDLDTTIAKLTLFSGDGLDGFTQFRIISSLRLIPNRRAIHPQNITRPLSWFASKPLPGSGRWLTPCEPHKCATASRFASPCRRL